MDAQAKGVNMSSSDHEHAESGTHAELASGANSWPRARAMMHMQSYFNEHAAEHSMLHGVNPAEQEQALEIANDPERAVKPR